MVIYEVPSGKEAAAIVLAALGAGAVTGTKTMLAMTTIDAKAAFEAGAALAAAYQTLGTA
jgi:hypothetical protein